MFDDDFGRALRTRNVWRGRLIGAAVARFLSASMLEQGYGIMFYACLASRVGIRSACIPFLVFSARLAMRSRPLAGCHFVTWKANRKQCVAGDGIEHRAPLSDLSSRLESCRLE